MTVYRRRKNLKTWHFCAICADRPHYSYEERTDAPLSEALCMVCLRKHQNGRCE